MTCSTDKQHTTILNIKKYYVVNIDTNVKPRKGLFEDPNPADRSIKCYDLSSVRENIHVLRYKL